MAVSKWCCRLIAHTMSANVCNVGLSYAWLGRSHVHSTSFAFVDDAKTYSRTSDSGGTNITFSILMKAHTHAWRSIHSHLLVEPTKILSKKKWIEIRRCNVTCDIEVRFVTMNVWPIKHSCKFIRWTAECPYWQWVFAIVSIIMNTLCCGASALSRCSVSFPIEIHSEIYGIRSV